jgi:hypothetical protein
MVQIVTQNLVISRIIWNDRYKGQLTPSSESGYSYSYAFSIASFYYTISPLQCNKCNLCSLTWTPTPVSTCLAQQYPNEYSPITCSHFCEMIFTKLWLLICWFVSFQSSRFFSSSEGKRSVGKPRRRWEDNIRMDLQEVGCGGMNWIGHVASNCECGNEPSGSIKRGEFLD